METPLSLRQASPHLPRVEERVGRGLFRFYDPAQCRRLPSPSSLGKTSRRRGGDPISAHRCSLASAEPILLALKRELRERQSTSELLGRGRAFGSAETVFLMRLYQIVGINIGFSMDLIIPLLYST